MAFLEIVNWVENRTYSSIVVDTAPSGHTLRLLAMPGLIRKWLLMLDALLAKLNMPITAAISVDVPLDDLMKRLTGRRTCKNCGQMFNVYSSAPKVENVCDKCGGPLFQRDDDNETTIKKRLDEYEAKTAPLAGYYKAQGKMKSVVGTGSIDDIFQKMIAAIGA